MKCAHPAGGGSCYSGGRREERGGGGGDGGSGTIDTSVYVTLELSETIIKEDSSSSILTAKLTDTASVDVKVYL